MSADRQPQRTCIGCRAVLEKNAVIRVVAGPEGVVIDYREKLPGRAAYICPRPECIRKALGRENLSRALHVGVSVPDMDVFLGRLREAIVEKGRSLLSMAARAGKLAAGASAVGDALQKGRVELLLFAEDIAEGTKEKLASAGEMPSRAATFLSRDELGRIRAASLSAWWRYSKKALQMRSGARWKD